MAEVRINNSIHSISKFCDFFFFLWLHFIPSLFVHNINIFLIFRLHWAYCSNYTFESFIAFVGTNSPKFRRICAHIQMQCISFMPFYTQLQLQYTTFYYIIHIWFRLVPVSLYRKLAAAAFLSLLHWSFVAERIMCHIKW